MRGNLDRDRLVARHIGLDFDVPGLFFPNSRNNDSVGRLGDSMVARYDRSGDTVKRIMESSLHRSAASESHGVLFWVSAGLCG